MWTHDLDLLPESQLSLMKSRLTPKGYNLVVLQFNSLAIITTQVISLSTSQGYSVPESFLLASPLKKNYSETLINGHLYTKDTSVQRTIIFIQVAIS